MIIVVLMINDRRHMAHLLHLNSSIQGESSTSRRLTARAAQRWQATHPGGTVTYRDLAVDPIPHLNASTGMARLLPAEDRTPAQHTSFALSEQLVTEVKQADTVLLGLPLYNYGPPSTVKAWVDHLVAPGLSIGADGTGLLADTDFVVIESRGGGYGSGTPRHGWDHAEAWLPHSLSHTGLQPKFIVAELTMADANPTMDQLKPLARESLDQAIAQIDRLWEAREHVA
jgi:FMN-dependent NADH-azoreductase